jgi:uncharacterized protein YkwD
MMVVSPDPTARRAPRHGLARAALGVVVWMAACAGPTDAGVEAVMSALGEPMGDFPSYEERVVLYATNRARVSPTTEGWPTYPAQPPMQWNDQLNQSSRAHSIDMRDTPCFQHPSCDGTDTFTRVLTYYTGPWSMLAENISAGEADPQTVVHDWINEINAAPGETGHRDSIFSSALTLIGVGFAAGGTTKTPNYWTQDFVGTSIKRPRLADGIHFPKTAAAGGQITFAATYYDAAVGAGQPQIFAVVDGTCDGLPLVRGTTGLGAYEGAVPLADGCHPYYFVATLGDGVALATYPDTGALQAGTGAAASTCALFATTRAGATCAGVVVGGTGAAGAGGTAGASGPTGTAGMKGTGGMTGAGGATGAAGAKGNGGAPGTTGAGGGNATGAAGASGSTGAGGAAGTNGGTGVGGSSATGAAGAPTSPTGTAGTGTAHGDGGDVRGSSGCSLASRAPLSRATPLWALVALFARARRRRRATSTSS